MSSVYTVRQHDSADCKDRLDLPAALSDGLQVPFASECPDGIVRTTKCGLPAERVALKGPIYSIVASPRCLAHAVAASRAGCRIRPVTRLTTLPALAI